MHSNGGKLVFFCFVPFPLVYVFDSYFLLALLYYCDVCMLVFQSLTGQFKSTVVCAECSRTATSFDPFLFLSLPLPPQPDRHLHVTLFSLQVQLRILHRYALQHWTK